MALASGLASQFGFAIETTTGTPVAPATFVPLVDESITTEIDRNESASIITGRRTLDSDFWTAGNVTISGSVGLELYNRSLSTLFRAMFGTVGTTGSGPYTHTYSPGDLSDDALTLQIGRPDVAGTVNPFTYRGCAVTDWELSCSAGDIATLGLDVVGMGEEAGSRVAYAVTVDTSTTILSADAAFTAKDVGNRISGADIPAGAYIVSVTSATEVEISAAAGATANGVAITIGTALGSASLASGLIPLTFKHGSVTVGGSALNVKAATLSASLGLDVDRRFLGSQYISAPLEADLHTYEGTLDIEFNSLVELNRYLDGDEFALVLAFTAGADSVTITCNVRYDGSTPVVDGPNILQQSMGFKCVGDTDTESITAVLINSDASA